MKKIIALIFTLSVFFLMSQESLLAQVENPVKKAKKKTERRINEKTDKGIDKGLNELEKGIGGLFKKNKKKTTTAKSDGQATGQATGQAVDPATSATPEGEAAPALNWAKYDFVPGDKVIFEDNLEGEENGEFPSRWDLKQGNVEIAQLGGENVIMFRAGNAAIIPYLKNPTQDYLPDIFTVEFDLYCGIGSFEVILYDRKNQKSGSPSGSTQIKITHNQIGWANSYSEIPDQSLPERRWVHIAIAYTQGKLKVYHDETRLVNIPRIDFDPKGITLYTYIFGTRHEGHYYVKNVRIAEGGVKYYDKFLQDGKIVSNGIRFDVGKATLRPESMGVLNKIYKLLSEHPEVNFSIEGHTDADGDFDFNQKLSEERAKTVMNQLVSMGISADRLTSKGFGESKPINTNDTPEGKANNRRVEFVKK